MTLRSYGGEHVGIAKEHPTAVWLFADDRQDVSRALLGRSALQRSHRHRKMIPAKGVVARDANLLNIGLALDAELPECRARGCRKGIPPAHRRLTRKQENDVLCHEAQNPLQIALCRGAQPT